MESSIESIIAKKLNYLFEKNNLTNYKFAKDTGIPETTIGRWRNGNTTPSARFLSVLSDYFNVSTTYFVEDDKPHITEDLDEEINHQMIILARIESTLKSLENKYIRAIKNKAYYENELSSLINNKISEKSAKYVQTKERLQEAIAAENNIIREIEHVDEYLSKNRPLRNISKLNSIGIKKVQEYVNDLVDTGKYGTSKDEE